MKNATGALEAPTVPKKAWVMWGTTIIFVIYLFNAQTGYAVLNPNVQKELHLSLREISIIASLYTWSFAVCQFFGGPLLDRLGARKVILPAILLVTLGVYMFATAQSFASLALCQVTLAIGACVGFVGAGYVGGQWFGMAKYGVMFGLVQSIVSFSSAFGQAGIALALHEVTWRHLLMDATWFGIAILLFSVVFFKDPQPVAKSTGNFAKAVFSELVEIAKIKHIWIATFWGAVCFGTQLAMGVVWGPKLLLAKGMSSQMANLCSAVVWLGLGIGCLFWGSWSDSIKARKTPAVVGLLLQVAMILVILFVPLTRPTLGLLVMLLLGLGSSGHMIAFSTAADVVSSKYIGASASFVNGAMFIMGGVLVAIPGHLLSGTAGDMAAYRFAFLPLLGLLIISLFVAVTQKETYPGGNPLPK